jgi:hypothetical protein
MIDKLKIGVNLFLIVVVGISLIGIWFVNNTNQQITARVIDSPENFGINSTIRQISENISFNSNKISYFLSGDCNDNQVTKLKDAMTILETKVNTLNFYQIYETSPDIMIECNNTEIIDKDLSRLSEGGPTLVAWNKILESKIILYENPMECIQPIVELHELLHVLGFLHTTSKLSIMYPIADCRQQMDREIVDILRSEYS